MSMLDRALELAIKAHEGQMYNDDDPYIFHVMRVVMGCPGENERIVAALHDVVEDAATRGFDMDVIRHFGFDQEIVEAVDAITKRDHETYTVYINRCKLNKLARRVKMVDVDENMSRVETLVDAARRARLRVKYATAAVILSEAELSQN